MKRLVMTLRSRCWKGVLSFGLLLSACSGSGKLMLGEVLPSDGTGGAGGTGLAVSDASPGAEDAACVAQDLTALTPALYLVVDRSNDMQLMQQQQSSRWVDLLDVLARGSGYLLSAAANVWNVGLSYYPNPCSFHPNNCPPTNNPSCSLDSYRGTNAPNMPIGAPDRVAGFLATSMGPGGPTAMRFALQGALQTFIPAWEEANQNQFVVPVIIAGNSPSDNDCNMMTGTGDVIDVAR